MRGRTGDRQRTQRQRSARGRRRAAHSSSLIRLAFLRDSTGSSLLNVLVGVDKRTSVKITIIAADRIAANDATVTEIVSNLRQLGHYGTLIIKTDGEPSLVELMTRVAAKREAEQFYREVPLTTRRPTAWLNEP